MARGFQWSELFKTASKACVSCFSCSQADSDYREQPGKVDGQQGPDRC